MVQLDTRIMSIGAVILAVIVALGVVTLVILGKPDQGLIVLFSSMLGAFFGGGVVHVAATPAPLSMAPGRTHGGPGAITAPSPTTPGNLSTGTPDTDAKP
jgi:hypothetical protein